MSCFTTGKGQGECCWGAQSPGLQRAGHSPKALIQMLKSLQISPYLDVPQTLVLAKVILGLNTLPIFCIIVSI